MPVCFFLNIPASHDAWTVDVEVGELSLFGFGWRAALAEEMLLHFSGILMDPCLAHRIRAPILWRHLASFTQGGYYHCRSAR
jgi:hypothetical protein